VTCCCGEPARDQPQAPPVDSKGKALEQLLGYLPAATCVWRLEPAPTATSPIRVEQTARWVADSIQSLLCVWVM
ncbi:MAG: hypothetical protein AABZ53_00355, partial [Planctomycetota bacterium]